MSQDADFEKLRRVRDLLAPLGATVLQPFLTRLLGDPQTATLVSVVVADSLPAVYLWMLEAEHAPPVREAREAERTSEVLRELGRILSAEHWDPFALEELFEQFPATRVFVERVLRHVEADTQFGKARHYARLIQGVLHTPTNEEQSRLEREAMADALADVNPTDIHILSVCLRGKQSAGGSASEVDMLKLRDILLALDDFDAEGTSKEQTKRSTSGYIRGRLSNLSNLGLLNVAYHTSHNQDDEGYVVVESHAEAHFELTDFGLQFAHFLQVEGAEPPAT